MQMIPQHNALLEIGSWVTHLTFMYYSPSYSA